MTEITNITPESHPDVWGLLQPPEIETSVLKTRIGMVREIDRLLSTNLSGVGYDNATITIDETSYVLTVYPDGSLESIVKNPKDSGGLDAAEDLPGQAYLYSPPTGGETIMWFAFDYDDRDPSVAYLSDTELIAFYNQVRISQGLQTENVVISDWCLYYWKISNRRRRYQYFSANLIHVIAIADGDRIVDVVGGCNYHEALTSLQKKHAIPDGTPLERRIPSSYPAALPFALCSGIGSKTTGSGSIV